MRFAADGPWLPDELLVARDEGRVLFFCGAGVSRAKAGLPDFLGLAKSVLRELRVLPESPAQQLIDTAVRLDPIAGVGGILAADRIFGLLEREFSVSDIERAVGAALKPHDRVDLSAHRTLLALSRDATKKVRLVTTNFDRLFEAAAPRVPHWTPDRLPDPKGIESFQGIVHLHGMFDADYDKPVGSRLVLSSAEFGRAYLAEGWATDFIRAVIHKYLLVFVGYAADDPPVQYLLEALNRVAGIRLTVSMPSRRGAKRMPRRCGPRRVSARSHTHQKTATLCYGRRLMLGPTEHVIQSVGANGLSSGRKEGHSRSDRASVDRSSTSPQRKMVRVASHSRSNCCPRVGYACSTRRQDMANREKPNL